MGDGQHDRRVALPYDSMADYYERNNGYKNALKFAVKAFEISGETYHEQRIKELKEKNNKG
jgi:hypothetical protein